MSERAALHLKAAELGKHALRMTSAAGAGHPSSALSLAQIVTYLMYRQMRYDPANPWHATCDRLVLSEGHAVPIVYAAYADLGGAVGRSPEEARPLRVADLAGLRDLDSVLDGHPNPAEGFPFFDAATGSLGQGLSVAAGLGKAARLSASPRMVYAIVGDGEAREGQIWEAVDFIVDHQLTNVCTLFNANGHGQAAAVSDQQSAEKLAAKLRAYGCNVAEIDGHDPDQIATAFAKLDGTSAPLAIVARTVKGWGVDALLKGNWHGKPLGEKELDGAFASLDRAASAAGAAGASAGAAALPGPDAPLAAPATVRGPAVGLEWPSFEDAMKAAGLGGALEKGQLSTRRAYGAALQAAGAICDRVVALDADVSNSTFSEMFAKAHGERFVECKIAEQNMASVAAGMAAAGFIPFANSFAKFISRAYDQIEMASISRANVKFVGSHSGISLASDGPSQMSLPDVAFFRSLGSVRGDDRKTPMCWSYHPADARAAFACTRLMLETPAMCYMRTHRPDVPPLYDAQTEFRPGGFHVLRGGEDLALISAGYMVHECLAAADLLARQARRVAIIDAYCLPLDGDGLLDALQRCGGLALVVEDNYGGGLGGAVAEAAARTGRARVATLHCQRVPKSARTPEDELAYCGVSAPQIADHARALLQQPG